MEIGQFIEALIGTFVGTITGGCIVIAANWLTHQWSKRKDAQEWYEKTYISEGIDPLIAYFVYLDSRFDDFLYRNKMKKRYISLENIDPIPVNALARIAILLEGWSPMWIIEDTLEAINDN